MKIFSRAWWKEKRNASKENYGTQEITTCLNCGNTFHGNYCNRCGQKANTNRLTLLQVFSHDLLYGLYNIQGSFFPTLKELFTRPGHATREYVQGKRIDFFNYFTLFVLVVTLHHILQNNTNHRVEDLFATHVNKKVFLLYNNLLRNHEKLVAFALIPINALISLSLFKRVRQNYAEHLVLSVYKTSGSLLVISVYYFISFFLVSQILLKITYVMISLIQTGYEFTFCYQYFSAFHYTKANLVLRCFLVGILSILLFAKKWVLIM
jgi:hypothetical protein